ncbi:MAG: 23S rRNA (adenine(2503)-C(2))-methyltransferase RlmN [Kiritimatiellaeota bacterium]|nr:23S rRNA (adenine(2503)-C(2))-methyltransferase RlmN [Kiritimatiellota bacterium]
MALKKLKHILIEPDESISGWLTVNGEPRYRTKQIFDWIYKKWCMSPDKMLNLPKELRAKLAESFVFATTTISERINSGDETEKLLISLEDGGAVEAVVLKAPGESADRTTFCLSSQVGCPVGCVFCASGSKGLERNLTTAEIVEQLLHCCAIAGTRPDNLVFMGVGEPLLNMDNLLPALSLIVSPARFAMAPRRITISTSGWTPGVKRLAKAGKQFNLAVSLHGTTDTVRAKVVPDEFRRPIDEVLEACREYRAETGRMITFEYTLVADLNDSPAQAAELAKLALAHHAKINLIPLNPVENSTLEAPDEDRTKSFLAILLSSGVQATCRTRKGDSIDAACGQLRLRGTSTQKS